MRRMLETLALSRNQTILKAKPPPLATKHRLISSTPPGTRPSVTFGASFDSIPPSSLRLSKPHQIIEPCLLSARQQSTALLIGKDCHQQPP